MLKFSLNEQLKKSPQQLLQDLLQDERFKDSVAQDILRLLNGQKTNLGI